MDEPKKLLLKKKLDTQHAKEQLKKIKGILLFDLNELNQNPPLEKRYLQYLKDWHSYKIKPTKKISIYSSIEELYHWILSYTNIQKEKEYYFIYHGLSITLYAKIKIIDPYQAIESLLKYGFFLIEYHSFTIYDIACYSDDEYFYSLYID